MRTKVALISLICFTSYFIPGCCFLHPGFKQANNPATYFISSTTIPASWNAHITTAAQTWNNASAGSFSFNNGGFTANWGFIADGRNTVFLAPRPEPNLLAEARPTNLGFCVVQEQEIGFNANQPWATDGFNHYDVQSVALHEFGHWIVLLHVICPSSSVMRASYTGIQRNLSVCDRLGLQVVYRFLPRCIPAIGICFPRFFSFSASDDTDSQDQMAKPFSENDEEMAQIWQANLQLQSDADSLGNFYAPIIEDWSNGGTQAYNTIFTSARYQEINNLINLIYPDASFDLRADLDQLRSYLQSKIGLSLGQIFSGDFGSYPDISDPGGGGGGGDGGALIMAMARNRQLLLALAAKPSCGSCVGKTDINFQREKQEQWQKGKNKPRRTVPTKPRYSTSRAKH